MSACRAATMRAVLPWASTALAAVAAAAMPHRTASWVQVTACAQLHYVRPSAAASVSVSICTTLATLQRVCSHCHGTICRAVTEPLVPLPGLPCPGSTCAASPRGRCVAARLLVCTKRPSVLTERTDTPRHTTAAGLRSSHCLLLLLLLPDHPCFRAGASCMAVQRPGLHERPCIPQRA